MTERNFRCEATGTNCSNPRCKGGLCVTEQEADAKAMAVKRALRDNVSKARAGKHKQPTTISLADFERML